MKQIKIFTDSTSDLTPEIIKENDISVVPMYVTFNENSYKDGIDITNEELYQKVDEYGKLPKTAAPSPTDYYNYFKPYVDNNYDIIYVGLSSKLSSALQNAHIAASEFPNGRIEIVDSMNLSTGIGLLVMKAIDYKNEGFDTKEISEKLRQLVPKVRTAFVIDTLDYLYKGGRCNALQNFFGSMLRIKPIVKVVDGVMILGQKARGKREKAINIMLDNVLQDRDNIDLDRIMITHSMAIDDAIMLKEKLEDNLDVKEVIITDAGCVISSHCGPKTVGILYMNK